MICKDDWRQIGDGINGTWIEMDTRWPHTRSVWRVGSCATMMHRTASNDFIAHMRSERNVEISNAAGRQQDRSGSASCWETIDITLAKLGSAAATQRGRRGMFIFQV